MKGKMDFKYKTLRVFTCSFLSLVFLFNSFVLVGDALTIETGELSRIIIDPLQKSETNGDYIEYIVSDFKGNIWKLTVNFSYNNSTPLIKDIKSEINNGTYRTFSFNKTSLTTADIIDITGNFNQANLNLPVVTIKNIKDYNNNKMAVLYYDIYIKIKPPSPPGITIGTITDFGTTWARADWTTDKPTDTDFRYSNKSETEDFQVYDPAKSITHTAYLTNLKPGTTYYYTAIATDSDGYFIRSKQNSFTTLSLISIISPISAGIYNTTNIPLVVSGNDNISFVSMWYSLNGGENTTFTSPTTITAVIGANTLIVYARDTAGYVVSASVSFNVGTTEDNIPPVISIISPINKTYNTTSITLSMSANEDINSAWYALNGGANTTFTSPTTITAIIGVNNLIVYASDTAGNVGSASVSFNVNLSADNNPPVINIISPINKTYNTSSITLNISANEGINSAWYSLNGGANTTFTSPTNITAILGANTLIVYANDTAGNVGSANVSFTVSVLAVLPWPMFHHDQKHTGLSTYIGSQTNGLNWSTTLDNVVSSPAIDANGTIYIGSGEDDKKLYAINPDGTIKWGYTTGGMVESSPAIGADGTIYVGSHDDYLYAINPSGTLKWRRTTGGSVSSSPVTGEDGTIYVGSDDDNLYAIYPNGTIKWSYPTNGNIHSSPAIGADGTIYVGSDDKNVYAIYPNGTKKWSSTRLDNIGSSPAIGSDGIIYVGSGENDKRLYAIYPNGTIKWSYQTDGKVSSSPAIGVDGMIYVGSDDTHLYAIYPNGTRKWRYDTDGNIHSSPAISADGTIYVGSDDNKLYAINPNGTFMWSYTTGGNVDSSPAIGADGTIYVGSDDNKLYAIGGNSHEEHEED